MKKNPDSIERRLYGILSKQNIRAMKMTIVLMMLTVCQIWAVESYAQSAKISLKLEDTKISEALKAIEEQTEFYFLYSPKLIDVEREIDIIADNETVDNVLAQLFGDAISKVISDRQIVLSPSEDPFLEEGLQSIPDHTQQNKIEGIVVDEEGVPLPGVTVVVKGTTRGAITDETGYYLVMVFPEDQALVFSFIGKRSRELIIGTDNFARVVLEEASISLDDIVVVGYMTQRKADLTGSISIVSTSQIDRSNSANVFKSLQGKLPGVHINSDGNPVEDVKIQIRGITSVNASAPLLVIDGVPSALNLRSINTNDIESIQILKDAASASIYGSRAAAGVILINTKQGKKGEMQVSYDGSAGVSAYLTRQDVLNTQQYGEVLWQATVNDGLDPNTTTQLFDYEYHTDQNGNPVLDKVTPVEWLNAEQTMRSTDTDWFKVCTQLGRQQEHNLAITTGTEKSSNMFSLNYYENNGTEIYTYNKRYSARYNSTYKFFGGRLEIGERLFGSYSKYRDENAHRYFVQMPPFVPVMATNGEYAGTPQELGMSNFANPYRVLHLYRDYTRNEVNTMGSLYADIEIIKNLHFKTSLGLNYGERFYRQITLPWQEAGGASNVQSAVTNYQNRTFVWTFTNTLLYNLAKGDHSLDVLIGTEAYKYSYESFSAKRDEVELTTEDYAYLDAATGGLMEVAGLGNENTLLSYFSKVNYSFMNKYLLSLTARYDGSSKFPMNNKFGFFPSVSAGWRISEENFMNGLDFLSDLKLRLSWGNNGNDNIPNNAINTSYSADYAITSYDIEGRGSGSLPSGYVLAHKGNPDLKWETTRQTDFGIDFSLFNNRLRGSFDYFHKVTDGMLFEMTYMAAVGEGAEQWINAANMTNNGVEAIITYSNDFTREFTFDITASLATFKNRIDDLPDAVRYQYGGNGLDDDILGRPLNSYYGFVVEGIFQTQEEVDEAANQPGKGVGRLRYADLDGDGQITWEYDRTWIGVSDPDLEIGLDFSGRYKNFDCNMFWQSILGVDFNNARKQYSDWWTIGIDAGQNKATRILNAWTPTNTDTDVPALSLSNTNNEDRLSTHLIESGDYLKLRRIELGYTLPASSLERINLDKLRISVTAQNILSIAKRWGNNAYTGVDPEFSEFEQYIHPQIFLIGINASF